MKIKNIFLNILLALVSILFAFLILEFSTRVYLENFATEKVFLQYASFRQLFNRYGQTPQYEKMDIKMRYSPHRYLGYYPTPNYVYDKNRHNALGFRGDEIDIPKPPGEFRIVCLGGSTTYTSHIKDYKLSYPNLLEAQLKSRGYENVTVINSGAGAWSSWETLINFVLRVLDLEPDMIIIYHGINDIHPRLVWPPEAYKGDNSGRRAPNSGIFMPNIFEYSTAIRMLMIRAGLIQSHAAMSRSIDAAPPNYYGNAFRSQKIKKTYPEGQFEKVSAQKMLEINKPIFFARNIENIVVLAKERGIKSILTSFAFSPQFKDKPRVSSREYISAFAEMNASLAQIAGKHNVNFFDFASVFPKDKKYYHDGRHVTIEGARLKAKLFADFIDSNLLIPQ